MKIGNGKDEIFMDLKLFSADVEPDDEDDDDDLFDDEEDDILNGEPAGIEEPKEKTFTQAELDTIIKDRLAREKKVQVPETPYEKFVREQATKFGLTPDEYIGKVSKQQEREALEAEAQSRGKTVQEVETERRLMALEGEKQASLKVKQDQERFIEQEAELAKAYPKLDLKKLDQNERFIKFLVDSNPKLTLLQVYENYVELTGAVRKSTERIDEGRRERSTGAGGDSPIDDAEVLLTKDERKLCKLNGIKPSKFLADKERYKKLS